MGVTNWEKMQNRIKRPDGYQEDRRQPSYYESSCMQCDVYDFCSKVHAKNAECLGYASQLRPLKLVIS